MDLRVNYLLLATALLGTFFSGTATRIVAISMPTVAQSLGTDLLGVSWAILSYQLSNIGLSVIFGRISDLWGREKMFALGFLVFAVSSLLCGFSQTVLQLIVARFVQGVGGAMLQSSSRALASESVTEDLAGRAQGYMTTAHHTGFILGPSIGGLMIDYFSWRWSFFLLAPIGFGGMLLALMNMKRRQVAPQHYPGSVDYLGAALLFAVTTTLVFILDRRTHQLIGSSTKFFLLAVFIGSLAAFLVHESRAQSPFVNLELFKIRRFSFSVVSLLVVSICYALTSFLMPFYLQDVLRLTPTQVGLLFMAPSVLTVALAPVSGYMTDRLGPRIPATAGVVFMIISLAAGGMLRTDSHWLLPTLVIVVGAITNGIFNPANSTAMISMMPKEHRGFASAMNHVTFGFGNVLGVALGGLSMSLAFEYHTGIKTMSLTAENPAGFVAALNTTFMVAIIFCVVGILTSALRGAESSIGSVPGKTIAS
ncbi:MAG TPA: MFS transporter [Candidatus Limnocylindrales bacterium]|nr:MFS transporter [Candidatus Limnocylindrales bacterium]